MRAAFVTYWTQYLDAESQTTECSVFVSKANHSITVIQAYAPTSNAEEAEIEGFYEDLQAFYN